MSEEVIIIDDSDSNETVLIKDPEFYTNNGGTVEMTAAQIASKIDTFTESIPVETDYIILGGKKRTLLSSVITFLGGFFQSKKSDLELYVSSGEKTTWSEKQDAKQVTELYVNQSQVDLIATISDKINRSETLTATEIQLLVSNLVDSSPEFLNTLNELSNAIANDPNFATTMTTELAKKVTSVVGYSLTKNDLTDLLKAAYDDAVAKKHEHTNKAVLDATEQSFTSALKTSYDNTVTAVGTLNTITEIAASGIAATYALELNKQVSITGTLPNGVSSTLTLPSPTIANENESVVHFASNATAAPTLVYSGFTPIWGGGKPLAMVASKRYTIVFEQIYNGTAWVVLSNWREY